MKSPQFLFHFPHSFSVELLPGIPPDELQGRQYTFPPITEEMHRDAVVLRVSPMEADPWVGVFALGFDSEHVVHAVYSCPCQTDLCVVSGGYAYLVYARTPKRWQRLDVQPVVRVDAVQNQKLLLFTGFRSITAWGDMGFLWQTPPLSWEGVTIDEISSSTIRGRGWDAFTAKETNFSVDLKTGESGWIKSE